MIFSSSLFHKNLKTLGEKNPSIREELFQDLSMEKLTKDFEIIETRTDLFSIRYKNQLLYSRFDPINDCQKRVESSLNFESLIILGLGLGYEIQELKKSDTLQRIIVFEPDTAWLFIAMHLIDFNFLGSFQVDIILAMDIESAASFLQEQGFISSPVFIFPAWKKLQYQWVEQFITRIKKSSHVNQVNKNTLKRFGSRWFTNFLRNMKSFIVNPGINDLKDLFQDFPAVIVAGGPSLDFHWEALESWSEKALIIAVDTVYDRLAAKGIPVDFLITVDPQYWNSRHIRRKIPKTCFIISESSVYPNVTEQIGHPSFYMSSLFPFGQYIENKYGKKGSLGAGGSVSTNAWDLAKFLGAKEIIFLGLDLSYPKYRSHFSGSLYENIIVQSHNRFQTLDSKNISYLSSGSPYLCTTKEGEKVLTDQRMDVYVFWFEQQLVHTNGISSYRVSKGTRQISGFAELDNEKIESWKKIRIELEKMKLQCFENWEKTSSFNKQRLDTSQELEKLTDIFISEISILLQLSKEAIAQIRKYNTKELRKQDISLLNRTLDHIDNQIMTLSISNIVGFLINDILKEIETENTNKNYQQLIAKNLTIYEGLEKSSSIQMQILNRLKPILA